MFRICAIAFALCFATCMNAQQEKAGVIAEQPQLTQSIADVLKIATALKPGMTRADVLRNFTTEGGLYSRAWNHYVYKGCPYIKIDITFEVPASAGADSELASDRIATVSKLYLEYSIAD